MKRVTGYIKRNWLWIFIGAVGTGAAVPAAYVQRGYFAVGSEWMILPMVLLSAKLVRGMLCSFMDCMNGRRDR